ncbi:MAG: hypothetical protein AAFV25_22355, partial [Bacteroidota bacterium]
LSLPHSNAGRKAGQLVQYQNMKPFLQTTLFFFALLLCGSLKAQVNHNNTTLNSSLFASAIGTNTTATGPYSFAGGENSQATALNSFAFGHYSNARGDHSQALGARTYAIASHSVAMGLDLQSNARMAITIGEGIYGNRLVNNKPSSLMVGFGSNLPTFFVGAANGAGKTGKVGIATSAPSAKLHVYDSGDANLKLNNDRSTVEWGIADASGSFSNWASAGDIVQEGQGNWQRMIFSTDAASSADKQFLFANNNSRMASINSQGQFQLYEGAANTGDQMSLDVRNSGNFYLDFDSPSGSTSLQRLHIGYVGNYNSNPAPNKVLDAVIMGSLEASQNGKSTDLHVFGEVMSCKMRTQEVLVENLGWCDYVFEKDYPLMPLKELREYIAENKHLPNIPSAEEVNQNGRQMADMQKRMMEKIEELTLYVLQLENKIEQLEKKQK